MNKGSECIWVMACYLSWTSDVGVNNSNRCFVCKNDYVGDFESCGRVLFIGR